MPSTRKTTYLKLSQFDPSDHPTWLGDYNGDMEKIDTGYKDLSNSLDSINTSISGIETDIINIRNANDNNQVAIINLQNNVQTISADTQTNTNSINGLTTKTNSLTTEIGNITKWINAHPFTLAEGSTTGWEVSSSSKMGYNQALNLFALDMIFTRDTNARIPTDNYLYFNCTPNQNFVIPSGGTSSNIIEFNAFLKAYPTSGSAILALGNGYTNFMSNYIRFVVDTTDINFSEYPNSRVRISGTFKPF